jgi:hypothetical protein
LVSVPEAPGLTVTDGPTTAAVCGVFGVLAAVVVPAVVVPAAVVGGAGAGVLLLNTPPSASPSTSSTRTPIATAISRRVRGASAVPRRAPGDGSSSAVASQSSSGSRGATGARVDVAGLAHQSSGSVIGGVSSPIPQR